MVVIGDVTDTQEHTITLLKSAQLLLEAYDKKTNTKIPLGKQAIINAITKLNERAEKRMPGTGRMQSKMSKRSANLCTPWVGWRALQKQFYTPWCQLHCEARPLPLRSLYPQGQRGSLQHRSLLRPHCTHWVSESAFSIDRT